MRFRFRRDDLKRLYIDATYTAGFGEPIVRGFRKYMQIIKDANDTRDVRNIKSTHFEKLEDDREGQHSIRLTKQWRLVFVIEKDDAGELLDIIEITDYH